MLTKAQIIERIQEVNRSVGREWLDVFNDLQLRRYLEHLQLSDQPRDGRAKWIHHGEVPAVVAVVPEA